MLDTLLLVAPREHVSGTTAVSLGVGHLGDFLLSVRQNKIKFQPVFALISSTKVEKLVNLRLKIIFYVHIVRL